jgi:hypothetical protein
MKQNRSAVFCCAALILVLAAVMLAGCKGSQSTPAAANNSLGSTYTSQTLTMSYPGALNAASQLMLGVLRLEGADNAITAEQAALLLPVVQALQGRVLQSDAERNAAWAYIEAHLTSAQSAAIAGMHLTQDDLSAWTQESGRGAGFGPGQGGAGQRGDAGTPPASGGAFPGGRGMPPAMGTRPAQFGRGTPQAGGTSRGASGGVSTGSGQDTLLLNALIRLLAQKSAGGAASPVSSRTPNRTPAPRPIPSPTPVPTSLLSPAPTKP